MFSKQVSKDGGLEGIKVCSLPEEFHPHLRDLCAGFRGLGCLWPVSLAAAWCPRRGCRQCRAPDPSLPVAPQSLGPPPSLLTEHEGSSEQVGDGQTDMEAHLSVAVCTSALTAPRLPQPPFLLPGQRQSFLHFLNKYTGKESDAPVHVER